MTMTTHDLTMLRYTQEYVPPGNTPSGPTPAPPLADLEAAMSQVTADPPPGTAPSAPEPSSEQAAPASLADALERLANAREQIAIAERDFAAIAAHLGGHN